MTEYIIFENDRISALHEQLPLFFWINVLNNEGVETSAT